MSAVTCLTWVSRGQAKHIPDKVEFNAKDFKDFVDLSMKSRTVNDSETEITENNAENDEDMAKYNLDEYDEGGDLDIDAENAYQEVSANDANDPYLDAEEDEFDEYEKNCFEIQDDDNLLIVGQAEEDSGLLAIYIYNEDDGDLYVHHDILLPQLPLSVEWIGCNPKDGSSGNFVAVGSLNSEISIWNLDVINALYPDYILGKEESGSKKPSKKGNPSSAGHTDSVLSISWNKVLRNVLASGSADHYICIWDIFNQSLLHKINYHSATVQSIQWHTSEPHFLLSGSTDGTVCLFNCKTPENPTMNWRIHGEVEKVLWNQFDPYYFICSTDLGYVYVIDCRKRDIHGFKAHEGAVTGLTVTCKTSKLLITAGADQSFKVWNMDEKSALVSDQKLEIGSIFALQVCPDVPHIVAVGGDNKANNFCIKNMNDL